MNESPTKAFNRFVSHSDLIKAKRTRKSTARPRTGSLDCVIGHFDIRCQIIIVAWLSWLAQFECKKQEKNHKTASFLVNICCLLYFQSFFFFLNFIFLLNKYLIVLSYKIVFTRYTKRVERLMKGGSIWFHAWCGNAWWWGASDVVCDATVIIRCSWWDTWKHFKMRRRGEVGKQSDRKAWDTIL